MQDILNDQFDWLRGNGNTTEHDTAPIEDVTTGTTLGKTSLKLVYSLLFIYHNIT